MAVSAESEPVFFDGDMDVRVLPKRWHASGKMIGELSGVHQSPDSACERENRRGPYDHQQSTGGLNFTHDYCDSRSRESDQLSGPRIATGLGR